VRLRNASDSLSPKSTSAPKRGWARKCEVTIVDVRWHPKRWAAGISAVYLLACLLPAVNGVPDPSGHSLRGFELPGYYLLVLGPLTLLELNPVWLANPVFALGLVRACQGRWRTALTAAVIALVLAAMMKPWVALRHGWSTTGLQIGYFAWLASMVMLFFLCCYGKWMVRHGVQVKDIEGESKMPEPPSTAG